MHFLVFLVVVSVIFSMASVMMEVWRAYRDKNRSIATAVAITCIVAGFPTMFAATIFEKQEPSNWQHFFEATGIVLFYAAGILGAVGLIWDRRIARKPAASESVETFEPN
jgi:Flp pilus assembly protein TadB